jgi:hypothetical protein
VTCFTDDDDDDDDDDHHHHHHHPLTKIPTEKYIKIFLLPQTI